MPPNTVKVCRPGKWGNPFRVGDMWMTTEDCVREYEVWLRSGSHYFAGDNPPTLEEIRRELAGKNLACFCKPGEPCHADVLLDMANAQGDR